MKKILLALALIASVAVKAQTIDTSSVKGFVVVKVSTPFKVNWSDTSRAFYLAVTLSQDNLKNSAVFNYALMSYSGRYLFNGSLTCKDADYAGWDGNSLFPFTFVASKLGITVK